MAKKLPPPPVNQSFFGSFFSQRELFLPFLSFPAKKTQARGPAFDFCRVVARVAMALRRRS
jgi:hypothetical protein